MILGGEHLTQEQINAIVEWCEFWRVQGVDNLLRRPSEQTIGGIRVRILTINPVSGQIDLAVLAE